MLCPECEAMWRDPKNRGACMRLCPKCEMLPIPDEGIKLTSDGLDTPGLTREDDSFWKRFRERHKAEPWSPEAYQVIKKLREQLDQAAEQMGVSPHEVDFTMETVQKRGRDLVRLKVWVKRNHEC